MASIRDTQRAFAACMGGNIGGQIATTDALTETGLILAGPRGGRHIWYHQQLNHLANYLLAITSPRKAAIPDQVRLLRPIMPTFSQGRVSDAPLIEDIMRRLSVGSGPQSGLIPGSSLPLGSAIERIIDALSNDHELGELLKQARFQLEVLETPPSYVPQANFLMEYKGRKYDWHYSGAAQYGAVDGTEVPATGPLVKTIRLGTEFFVAAAELWADTQRQEREVEAE